MTQIDSSYLSRDDTPSIALSFIMKNEGEYALNMISSVADIVNFISCVDTGSTDNSMYIVTKKLEQLGIPFKIAQQAFHGFDQARNASLDLVPNEIEWILILDCDEVLVSSSRLDIKNLVEQTEYDAVYVARFNWQGSMWRHCQANYPDYQGRLIKNHAVEKIRFAGSVHEEIRNYQNVLFHQRNPDNDFTEHGIFHIHHLKLVLKSQSEIEERDKFYASFVPSQHPVLDDKQTNLGGNESMSTSSFELNNVRRLHKMTLRDYGLPDQSAFWCEWSHPNEGSRTLTSIVDGLLVNNWGSLINPGATCIDIGAHSGDTAIPMGLFCSDYRRGIKGRVFAIEPNPDVFGVLEINLALNEHLCDFVPLKYAIIRESSGRVKIADHGNGNCNGGIVEGNYGKALHDRLTQIKQIEFEADGINLETLYKNHLSHVDKKNLSFIKIDCEGYDKEILRSSREFLAGVRPVIFIEWFDLFSDVESHDLFSAVEEIGYEAFESYNLLPASVTRKVHDLVLKPKSR